MYVYLFVFVGNYFSSSHSSLLFVSFFSRRPTRPCNIMLSVGHKNAQHVANVINDWNELQHAVKQWTQQRQQQ